MLSEIFIAFLIASLAGSCLAAIIALVKPITKKFFGCAWQYYIWLCVLLVMLIPVRFDIKPAAMPSTETQIQQTSVNEELETNESLVQTDTALKTQLFEKVSSVWNKVVYNRVNILTYVWLTGAIALILVNIARYVQLNLQIRKNTQIISCPEVKEYTDRKINVRVWENTSSPFMTGIFRPTLVLPKTNLSEEQLHNILLHEITHFKRFDILYKWFAELVKCVHWFNPIAWYVAKQVAAECEISCDMAVTQNMSNSEKKCYINTILSLLPTEKTQQLPLTTQMTSSKKILKRRFLTIKNKKATGKLVSILSAAIALVIFSTTVFASGILSNLTTNTHTTDLTDRDYVVEGEYVLKLPVSWDGKYIVHITENGSTVRFIQKATYDKYGENSGELFAIKKLETSEAYNTLYIFGGSEILYQTDAYAYVLTIPTDVQYPIWAGRDEDDIEIAEEYKKMFADITNIADSFAIYQ